MPRLAAESIAKTIEFLNIHYRQARVPDTPVPRRICDRRFLYNIMRVSLENGAPAGNISTEAP